MTTLARGRTRDRGRRGAPKRVVAEVDDTHPNN
jgi:hypothetical protein